MAKYERSPLHKIMIIVYFVIGLSAIIYINKLQKQVELPIIEEEETMTNVEEKKQYKVVSEINTSSDKDKKEGNLSFECKININTDFESEDYDMVVNEVVQTIKMKNPNNKIKEINMTFMKNNKQVNTYKYLD